MSSEPLNGTTIFLHEEFYQWLDDAPPHHAAAAHRAIELLAVGSQPSRQKGVKGANAGWTRTQVGGTGGRQFYLWYAPTGARPVKDRLPPRACLIRAVRHHDETSTPIDAGTREQWVVWAPRDILQVVASDASPYSPTQQHHMRADDPVQILRGSPGSGKTTVLQHAVLRLDCPVLYVTFSAALTARAERFARTLGASGQCCSTFRDLVAEINGAPVAPDARDGDLSLLATALAPRLSHLGPWRRKGNDIDVAALHAELHAYVVGRQLADWTWTRADYLAARAARIGHEAAEAAWEVAAALTEATLEALFPGPLAARRAVQRLRADASAYRDFGCIAVDEVQDLTLAELEVIVALAEGRPERPALRLAGDEAQTIRATGFAWSDAKKLVGDRLARPVELSLSANLRSTREVAALARRVSDYTYRDLPKEARPAAQGKVEVDPVAGGQVVLLDVAPGELDAAMRVLSACGAVITPDGERTPAIATASLAAGAKYLTAADVKGLDFEAIAVVGLGATLAAFDMLTNKAALDKRTAERARLLADSARVAVTRATSLVVLVEIDPSRAARNALKGLFAGDDPEDETPIAVTLAELEERLTLDSGDAITRLDEAMTRWDRSIDRDPSEALRDVDDAHKHLLRAGRSGAIGHERRQEIYRARAATRLLVGLASGDDLDGIQRELGDNGDAAGARSVQALRAARRADKPSELGKALEARDEVHASTGRVARAVAPHFDAAIARCVAHLATTALTAVNAPIVLGLLDRIGELPELPRLRALACEATHHDDTAARWVDAGDPARGLAWLRAQRDHASASAFAQRHGLQPPTLDKVQALLADLEALTTCDDLTTRERKDLLDRARAVLAPSATKSEKRAA